ncbi:hypothetical protein Pcinc_016154 [Petrolisthes cinctipes]|uniref:Uncharacterized protein n=1 Tax=Petrolisthes cinctipes TaxID=88211 RepID=A0AAE1KM91_PETCI|nr:hypothetical protein Pcinc_035276 [Petrolisthes cinctipes]KAK3879261.1 hypothetical protein Pcinc_016154 [Petrolisthes cinctipes]
MPDNTESPVDLSLLGDVFVLTKNVHSSSNGVQYYLQHYGRTLKLIITDVMDSYGMARNIQLAIPILAKLLLISVYIVMQFQPAFLSFQKTTRAAFTFLQQFNSPDLKMMNDITDNVFEVLDNDIVTVKYV